MSPISFLSTLFLAPCLKSEPRSPPQRTYSRTIECNQYERRLYLRPIMPPTTRRQSRLLGEGEILVEPLVESRRSSKSESRKGNNAKKENVEVDPSSQRKQSGVNFDVPVQGEDEQMEDATGDVPMEDVQVPTSASSSKERTLSTEMNDALQALHRGEEDEEEDGDDQARNEEDDEDDEQPTWSDEDEDEDKEDTQEPRSKDKKQGEDVQALYDEYDDEEDELPTWSEEDDDDDGDSKGDDDDDEGIDAELDAEIDAEVEEEDQDIEAPLPDEEKGTGNISTQFVKFVS